MTTVSFSRKLLENDRLSSAAQHDGNLDQHLLQRGGRDSVVECSGFEKATQSQGSLGRGLAKAARRRDANLAAIVLRHRHDHMYYRREIVVGLEDDYIPRHEGGDELLVDLRVGERKGDNKNTDHHNVKMQRIAYMHTLARRWRISDAEYCTTALSVYEDDKVLCPLPLHSGSQTFDNNIDPKKTLPTTYAAPDHHDSNGYFNHGRSNFTCCYLATDTNNSGANRLRAHSTFLGGFSPGDEEEETIESWRNYRDLKERMDEQHRVHRRIRTTMRHAPHRDRDRSVTPILGNRLTARDSIKSGSTLDDGLEIESKTRRDAAERACILVIGEEPKNSPSAALSYEFTQKPLASSSSARVNSSTNVATRSTHMYNDPSFLNARDIHNSDATRNLDLTAAESKVQRKLTRNRNRGIPAVRLLSSQSSEYEVKRDSTSATTASRPSSTAGMSFLSAAAAFPCGASKAAIADAKFAQGLERLESSIGAHTFSVRINPCAVSSRRRSSPYGSSSSHLRRASFPPSIVDLLRDNEEAPLLEECGERYSKYTPLWAKAGCVSAPLRTNHVRHLYLCNQKVHHDETLSSTEELGSTGKPNNIREGRTRSAPLPVNCEGVDFLFINETTSSTAPSTVPGGKRAEERGRRGIMPVASSARFDSAICTTSCGRITFLFLSDGSWIDKVLLNPNAYPTLCLPPSENDINADATPTSGYGNNHCDTPVPATTTATTVGNAVSSLDKQEEDCGAQTPYYDDHEKSRHYYDHDDNKRRTSIGKRRDIVRQQDVVSVSVEKPTISFWEALADAVQTHPLTHSPWRRSEIEIDGKVKGNTHETYIDDVQPLAEGLVATGLSRSSTSLSSIKHIGVEENGEGQTPSSCLRFSPEGDDAKGRGVYHQAAVRQKRGAYTQNINADARTIYVPTGVAAPKYDSTRFSRKGRLLARGIPTDNEKEEGEPREDWHDSSAYRGSLGNQPSMPALPGKEPKKSIVVVSGDGYLQIALPSLPLSREFLRVQNSTNTLEERSRSRKEELIASGLPCTYKEVDTDVNDNDNNNVMSQLDVRMSLLDPHNRFTDPHLISRTIERMSEAIRTTAPTTATTQQVTQRIAIGTERTRGGGAAEGMLPSSPLIDNTMKKAVRLGSSSFEEALIAEEERATWAREAHERSERHRAYIRRLRERLAPAAAMDDCSRLPVPTSAPARVHKSCRNGSVSPHRSCGVADNASTNSVAVESIIVSDVGGEGEGLSVLTATTTESTKDQKQTTNNAETSVAAGAENINGLGSSIPISNISQRRTVADAATSFYMCSTNSELLDTSNCTHCTKSFAKQLADGTHPWALGIEPLSALTRARLLSTEQRVLSVASSACCGTHSSAKMERSERALSSASANTSLDYPFYGSSKRGSSSFVRSVFHRYLSAADVSRIESIDRSPMSRGPVAASSSSPEPSHHGFVSSDHFLLHEDDEVNANADGGGGDEYHYSHRNASRSFTNEKIGEHGYIDVNTHRARRSAQREHFDKREEVPRTKTEVCPKTTKGNGEVEEDTKEGKCAPHSSTSRSKGNALDSVSSSSPPPSSMHCFELERIVANLPLEVCLAMLRELGEGRLHTDTDAEEWGTPTRETLRPASCTAPDIRVDDSAQRQPAQSPRTGPSSGVDDEGGLRLLPATTTSPKTSADHVLSSAAVSFSPTLTPPPSFIQQHQDNNPLEQSTPYVNNSSSFAGGSSSSSFCSSSSSLLLHGRAKVGLRSPQSQSRSLPLSLRFASSPCLKNDTSKSSPAPWAGSSENDCGLSPSPAFCSRLSYRGPNGRLCVYDSQDARLRSERAGGGETSAVHTQISNTTTSTCKGTRMCTSPFITTSGIRLMYGDDCHGGGASVAGENNFSYSSRCNCTCCASPSPPLPLSSFSSTYGQMIVLPRVEDMTPSRVARGRHDVRFIPSTLGGLYAIPSTPSVPGCDD